ncbi:glycosyltransferase [Haloplanus rallus]|jgi:glycosyltransferase involved in cell wall biosynthesis|uniref:Glycosyltransferase n=1 Tax=Haloplanus rallus TaxID=1816183 RepID=A0A6B9FDP8_9EURY|nr:MULTISPECIES: glycosyltransferase [Haloplanus]QGX94680.1 glycosyltransferase [Haloplanus rallus]
MSRSVGVVIPAYHPDVDRLERYVDALRETVAPETIRVELDAPGPGVLDRIDALPVTVGESPSRRGKGAAITAGFEALSTDVVAFADADGSTPATSVADVIRPVATGETDLAAGSRRHPDATVESHQTVARRYLGDGFAWLARRLLDVHLYDYQCGAKALTREAWTRIRPHLHEPGFAWDIELLAVADAVDCRIAEVPVVWEDRPESTVSPVGTTLRLARGLLVARHRARLLRNDRLHEMLDRSRDSAPALVDRDHR